MLLLNTEHAYGFQTNLSTYTVNTTLDYKNSKEDINHVLDYWTCPWRYKKNKTNITKNLSQL